MAVDVQIVADGFTCRYMWQFPVNCFVCVYKRNPEDGNMTTHGTESFKSYKKSVVAPTSQFGGQPEFIVDTAVNVLYPPHVVAAARIECERKNKVI